MTNRVWPTIDAAVKNSRRTAVAPLGWNPTDHLLSRFAFGPTQPARAWVAAHGPTAWYKQQLSYGTQFVGYTGSPMVAAQGPLLKLAPWDLREYLKAQGKEYGWDAMDQLTRVTLGLQAWSRAQLYETLVDFFSNHLNVANHSGDVWITRHAYDRDVIRRHAMGSFTDMLLASARHPAMLIYLDLDSSTKTNINENYGRELLELHTVGLVYSEQDVKDAAKLLTGRSVDSSASYVFKPYRHYVGPVKVLGFHHPNGTADGGDAPGDALIRYLAGHPATATRLATKLCQRYVSDRPSAALIAAVAKAYHDSGTKILPMVSTILRSTEFWESRGRKTRRPTENLIATLRILGSTPSNAADALTSLHWMSSDIGHVPLDWGPPDGYPDVARSWRSSSTLIRTWTQHLGFADDWWSGFKKFDKVVLYGGRPRTSGEAITMLTKRIAGQPFSATHRAALQRFLNEPASTPIASSRLQWLLPALIAVILDGPHHALR